MKLVKYTLNPDDWIVLTDAELAGAEEEWAKEKVVKIGRIQKTLPPPKFHPYGSIPGLENEDLFFRTASNQVIAWNRTTYEAFVLKSIANEEGYYSFTRITQGVCRPEKIKAFIENETLVPIDKVINLVYNDYIKMPGQRAN